ncbi:MAG: iron hydrogenase small subunit [Clostridia bacterium]|nr:iron hydrogenase small subunit [Clostridia bacterium]
MAKMVSLTIDGINVEVEEGTSVLKAAKDIGIMIPTLCYLNGVNSFGGCRICVVDAGAKSLLASCTLPAAEGMVIKTNTKEVQEARRMNMELILSNHDRSCLTCDRNGKCELQDTAFQMNVDEIRFDGKDTKHKLDLSSPAMVRDPNKCILCRRCVAACGRVQDIGVIGPTERGFRTIVEPAFKMSLGDVACINCGQCLQACPTGAITIVDDTKKVWDAIADPNKHVVVQTAPAVRAALGEEFGLPIGTCVTGKMATALKRLGFDRVFDTDFAADLTIMEEGTEFIGRLQNNGVLPMITSCSPGWIKFMEHNYHDFLPNMSSCKSPQQMMGSVIKNYYAPKMNIPRENIVSVSVMPCSAKKFEAGRPEFGDDVDVVITTQELGRMIRMAGIDFERLPDSDFDPLLGDSTGAAVIFGVTGGVMEAALRTVYEVLTKETLEQIEFESIRGMEGLKEATVKINDLDVKIAVAHGTANARKLLDSIRSGEKEYHFIEIMACPGGCINGGGQPLVDSEIKLKTNVVKQRAKALYSEDRGKALRKSHENPSVQQVYKDWLGEPGGHKSHEFLHTKYVERDLY